MPEMDPIVQAYRAGAAALCRGDAEEAVRRLEAVPAAARTDAHAVVLAKAYLEVGRGADGLEALERTATDPPDDPGERAYRELLLAASLAAAGRPDDALRRLDGVAAVDPRLEAAARSLARRIESGRAPLVRL